MNRVRGSAMGLLAAAAVIAGCSSESDPGDGSPVKVVSPAASTDGFRGATFEPPRVLPDVTLTDTAGRQWNLAERGRDRVTVVYFGYTNCPDVCPTDMADLATARRALDPAQREQVEIVFVTVDQRRDTRPVIRRWLDRFDPTLVGLTGMPNDLSAAARALGVPYRVNASGGRVEEVEHSSQMTAFGPDGRSGLLWVSGTSPADISHDMALLVSGTAPA